MSSPHNLNYSANLSQPNVYRDLISFFHEMLSSYNFDAGAVYLPSESNDNIYELFYSVGFPQLYCEKLRTVIKGYGFGGTTAVLHTVRVSENTENDSRFAIPIPFQAGFHSFVSVPLMAGETMMGLLNFAYYDKVKFSLGKREALLLLGKSLGMYLKTQLELLSTLEQGRLFRKMYVLGTELFRINDLPHICNIVLEESMVLLGANCGFIVLEATREVFSKGVVDQKELLDEISGILSADCQSSVSDNININMVIERNTLKPSQLLSFFEQNNLAQLYVTRLLIGEKFLGLLAFGQESNQYKTFDVLALNQITQYLSMAIHKFYYNKTEKERAVVREHERISRVLHDSLAQQLAAIMNRLEFFERSVREQPYWETIAPDVRELKEMTYDASQDIRESISGLRLFSMDDDASFLEILEKLRMRSAKNMPEVELEARIEMPDITLPFDVQLQLLLIVQESLTNIRRHSRATKALLSLQVCDGKLLLEVRDNGVGFDLSQQGGGYGLSVMQERAEEINAEFKLFSEPGKGTAIMISLACWLPETEDI